ncbi:MAG: FAD-binding oxidoreductase [Verrucomicrobiaceae bacterium]|nr:FAD-binding oxidoreductase [Verrucomicrobiaceae bacterium]
MLYNRGRMQTEFLIVGQGLAGTTLAWRLLERGRSFVIVDRDEAVTCSRAAAGLVTPVTGLRLTLNWRYDALHPEAVRFYREKEGLLGGRFYHPRPLVRLLKTEEEAAHWQRRRHDERVRRYIHPTPPEPLVDEHCIANPLGGFQQRHAGFLDTAAFLDASRGHFQALGCWRRGEVREDEIEIDESRACWAGGSFGTVVFCQGWEAARSRWFSWLPFDPARGTILTLRGDVGETRRIINRGCWLVPRGDGLIRAGSTYEMRFDRPHEADAREVDALLAKLHAVMKTGFEVVSEQTAVRPVIKWRNAMIGRHPAHPQLAIFNGLGSKGVLRAPFIARRLTEHLLDGTALDSEFDVQANL